MDHWMDDVVSMMSGAAAAAAAATAAADTCGTGRIKQEADACSTSTGLCSPTRPASTMLMHTEMDMETKEEPNYPISPASPDRHFCSSTTQPIGLQHIEDSGNCVANGAGQHGPNKEDESPRRLCLVCGDVASGFHYGVASCEACKAFFKRTIQGNIEYTCPASNDCEINKRRRKACQACRFRKCLRTGMLREGVRLDRVRGGRQKYRRVPEVLSSGAVSLTLNSTPYGNSSDSIQPRPALEDIKILEVLCSYEPDALMISPPLMPSSDPDRCHTLLCMLSDIYDKELVGVIGWTKQIPGFTELQLNDQMRLLQSTWTEMLTLMLAYRSMQAHVQMHSTLTNITTGNIRLKFAANISIDEQEARDIGANDMYNLCMQIIHRLERVSVIKEEYYLLKALALANSDVRLDEVSGLKKFREAILTAFNDSVSILRPYNASAVLQQLLLILPCLRQADTVLRRFWMNIHREGKIPMNKLFVEMLEPSFR